LIDKARDFETIEKQKKDIVKKDLSLLKTKQQRDILGIIIAFIIVVSIGITVYKFRRFLGIL